MDNSYVSLEERTSRRKARVKRLKRAIIFITVTAILLPSVICVFLLNRVSSLQKQIDTLNDNLAMTIAQQELYQKNFSLAENISDTGTENELQESAGKKPGTIEKMTAYLTFDDGPSENTIAILDILKEYDIKATFFVIGKETDEAKEIYKRIVDEGHTLGMHSFSHQYSAIYDSVEAFDADTTKLQDYLEEITGFRPNIYRFPGGSSNLVSNIEMSEFIKYLNKKGITYFDWNVASGDATSQNVDVDTLVNNVLSDVTLFETSVILMHDSAVKVTTVEALPQIIEKLQEMGIEIKPITADVTPIQHIKFDSVN